MRRRYVPGTYGQMHVVEAGSGPVLVLLHFTAGSWRQYEAIIPLLADHFHLIAPDTPGFGNSDAPSGPVSIEAYARNVLATLDTLGIGRFAILGFRTGAPIAAEVAAQAGSRITGVVLAGCPDYTPEQRAASHPPSHYKTLEEDGSHILDSWNFLHTLGDWITTDQMQVMTLDTVSTTGNPLWPHDALLTHNLNAALGAIQAPTLLLYSDSDRFKHWADVHLPLLAHGEFTTIPAAGHFLMLEKPAEFAAAIQSFLNSSSAP